MRVGQGANFGATGLSGLSPEIGVVFEDGLADGPGMWASIVNGKEQPLVPGTSRISVSLTDL